ncbi:collagen-like protein [Streptomyces albus]|uniref:collagen-like triple helix repeat-containing protein n=1 Tax=Streptomyces albus TaxID=1888 RepID=UPI00370291C8
MSSSLRRGTLAAATLALAAVSLTACGAGNDAQTLRIRPDNAATHVGDIKIQNVNIVTDPHGSGEATVTARIFNEGSKDQVLKGVTSKGARAELSPAKGEKKLVVPAGGSLKLGGKDEASALLADAEKAGVRNGDARAITFDLSRTGDIKLKATVVPAKGAYKTVGPSSSPSSQPPKPGTEQSGEPGENGKPGESGKPGQSTKPGQKGDASSADNAGEQGEAASTGQDGQEGGAGH